VTFLVSSFWRVALPPALADSKTFELNLSGTPLVDVSVTLTDLSIQENDVVVLALGADGTNNVAKNCTISGYTVVSSLFANDTRDVTLVVQYKIMGSTPDTAFTFPASDQSLDRGGAVFVFRNINTSTVQDATATTFTDIDQADPNPASITTATDKAIVFVAGAGVWSLNNQSPYTSSDLTGFLSQTAINFCIGAGYKIVDPAGAFNPAQFATFTGNTGSANAAVTMALKPA
jgi:hypothetical protein